MEKLMDKRYSLELEALEYFEVLNLLSEKIDEMRVSAAQHAGKLSTLYNKSGEAYSELFSKILRAEQTIRE